MFSFDQMFLLIFEKEMLFSKKLVNRTVKYLSNNFDYLVDNL